MLSSSNISWALDCTVKDGKKDEMIAVMEELVANSKEEEGTLVYEWAMTDDGKSVHLSERFEDMDAAKKHLKNVGPIVPRLLECVENPTSYVYSKLDDELMEMTSAFSATYMNPIGGFAR